MKRATKATKCTVYRLRKKAERIGSIEAADQLEAMEKAYKEFEIPQHERFRISVQRE